MLQLNIDDICAFKSDPLIIGIVEYSWCSIESQVFTDLDSCYVHKDLPWKITEKFVRSKRPPRGYVIISFLNSFSYCLIGEHLLNLVDRTLAVGDVVKRKLSDRQSGTVINASLTCTLQPCPSMEMTELLSSYDPYFAALGNTRSESAYLEVSAHEIKRLHRFYCGDSIIYLDWIGRVKDVGEEVTVRLSNGSTVVVEDPDLLNEPPTIPGSEREALMERLNQAGYSVYQTKKSLKQSFKTRIHPAYPFYAGKIVDTKQANLRRGRWIDGTYDAKVGSRAVIVEVRCKSLEVSWGFVNMFKPFRESIFAPPIVLGIDVIESGLIKVYDNNRSPSLWNGNAMSSAIHTQNFALGDHVKLRDQEESTAEHADLITGRDEQKNATLNLNHGKISHVYKTTYQIRKLQTKVTVQWQDLSTTAEDSNTLFAYLNVDEHDLWPGDVASLVEQETKGWEIGLNTIRTRTVGVVQSVDSIERIARLRWFDDTDLFIRGQDRSQLISGSLGPISERFSDVSLYEIAAHPALARDRGNLVIVVPSPLPPREAISVRIQNAVFQDLINITLSNSAIPRLTMPQILEMDSPERVDHGIDWFGEITDISLDGYVTVRLGALSEVRDISIPMSRTIIVDDGENSDSIYESSISEEDDLQIRDHSTRSSGFVKPKEITMEYEGGSRLDTGQEDQDDNMWDTEDDASPVSGSNASNFTLLVEGPPNIDKSAQTSRVNCPSLEKVEISRCSSKSSVPPQFAVLESLAPADHYYYQDTGSSNKNFLRRMNKEHRIMQSSIPDGIFVRTWENRLDLLRVLIVGPRDTPYENAPFVIDLHLGQNFPTSPPNAYFHSWTNGIGRINPNLYEDGNICLSLLGTWPAGEKNEGWSEKSTILQILVSVMGLVLVKEPYYNEAGFETFVGTEESRPASYHYSERAFVIAKGFIKTALVTPPSDLGGIIKWLYLSSYPGPHLLHLVVQESKALIEKSASTTIDLSPSTTTKPTQYRNSDEPSTARLSSGAVIMLRRTVEWLERYLAIDEGGAVGGL